MNTVSATHGPRASIFLATYKPAAAIMDGVYPKNLWSIKEISMIYFANVRVWMSYESALETLHN